MTVWLQDSKLSITMLYKRIRTESTRTVSRMLMNWVEQECVLSCIVRAATLERYLSSSVLGALWQWAGWCLVFVPWSVTRGFVCCSVKHRERFWNISEMFIIHITDEETEGQVGPQRVNSRDENQVIKSITNSIWRLTTWQELCYDISIYYLRQLFQEIIWILMPRKLGFRAVD